MRTILTGLLAMIGLAVMAQESPPRPVVGAIRWDAWTGGDVTVQVETTLGPRKYHNRLPWFAEVLGENKVRIDGSRQATMDREIDFASDAGLDYWAFLLDDASSSMSTALKQYLQSPRRKRINFCIILHNTLGVHASLWPAERDRAVAVMKEPGYQTVLGGRPLVYVFDVMYEGEFPTDRLAEFQAAAGKAGLNPYLVFMGWDPEGDFTRQSLRGFHAVSAYSYGGGQTNFQQLAQSLEQNQWQNAAKAGVPYIPLVTTGFDRQPRRDNPVSWEKDLVYRGPAIFPAAASPQDLAGHLERALTFVRTHLKMCPAKAIIVYAWNDYDQGGWLAPTLGPAGKPDTGRLDAISRVLKAPPPAIVPPAAAARVPAAGR
jgi:hypothetical protein